MRNLFNILILFVLVSCSGKPNSLSFDSYTEFLNDPENGLIRSNDLDDLKLTYKYKPFSYRSYKLAQTNDSLKLDENTFFQLKISSLQNMDVLKYKVNDMNHYYYRLQYFNTDFKNDFTLVHGSDTLNCLLAQVEYVAGLSDDVNVNLVFPAIKKIQDNLMISYKDNTWETGTINVSFLENNITDLPQLIK